MGFAEEDSHPPPGGLLPHHFTLTETLRSGGIFLLHFPWPCDRSTLSTILLVGARTFLPPDAFASAKGAIARPPDLKSILDEPQGEKP